MAKPKCKVDDCPTEAEKRGLCAKHYRRLQRSGTTDLIPREKPLRDDEAEFWARVSKDGPIPVHSPDLGPCWVWTGPTDDAGYGLFYFTGKTGKRRRTRAHRWILGNLRGKPLSRKRVGEEDGCHRCDYKPCVRPSHLYVGTRVQNLADAVERRRLWQTKIESCPKGHPLDGVKVQKNGRTRRFCKTCAKAGQRKHRTEDRKTCKNGHKLEGDNILLCRNGTRKCRICDEARVTKMLEARRRKAA